MEGLEPVPLSSEIWQSAQQTAGAGAVGKAVVVGEAIVAGIVWLVEQVKESGTYMAPPVPGGLGIPGYNPLTKTFTPRGAPPAKVNTTPTDQPANTQPNSREGKPFTPKEKEKVIEANKAKNNGNTVCEDCGTNTTKPEQSKKGVTPPKTDTQVDHIKPKSKGRSGTADNGQVLCRYCNGKKSNRRHQVINDKIEMYGTCENIV